MPVLVTPYVYANNATLDAEQHNRNLYSTTPGQGILSEPNGGVGRDKLSSSFEVKTDHLQPEQLVMARAQGSVSTLDNMGDTNFTSAGPVDSTTGEITHLNVEETMKGQMLPGCGIRIYLPFEASVVLWHASFFWHVSRFAFPDFDGQTRIPPAIIRTRMEIDGVGEPHTQRDYPPTVFQKSAEDVSNNERYMNSVLGTHTSALQSTETMMSQHRDICHMSGNLSAGFHEMYLSFYVEPRGNLRDLIASSADYNLIRNPLYARQNLSVRGADHYIKQIRLENRLTVGCRHARVIAFR